METVMKNFSVELPEEVINGICRVAKSKKESVESFLTCVLKKEIDMERERKWRDFEKHCAEERADAAAVGMTEQDIKEAIRYARGR